MRPTTDDDLGRPARRQQWWEDCLQNQRGTAGRADVEFVVSGEAKLRFEFDAGRIQFGAVQTPAAVRSAGD